MADQVRRVELLGMKKTPFLVLTAATLVATATAQATVQTPATPASWNNATLSQATYVVLDGKVEGNPNLVSKAEMDNILASLKRDSAGAIKRRYPNAVIATDLNTPGAIKVTPTLVTPNALVPWASLSAKLDLDLPEGSHVTLVNNFSVLTLWQKGYDAANYAYDQLALKMP